MKKKKEKTMEFINATEPPAGGDPLTWGDHEGKLLLIEPVELVAEIATSFGPTTAIRANVHIVTGPAVGTLHEDVLIFPKVLQSQLRQHIGAGAPVVGRLSKGDARPGKLAPYKLIEATADDLEKAKAYWIARSAPQSVSTAAEAPF